MSLSGTKFERKIESLMQSIAIHRHGSGVLPPPTNDDYLFKELSEVAYYRQPVGISFPFLQVSLSDNEKLKKEYIESGKTTNKGSVDWVLSIENPTETFFECFKYAKNDGNLKKIRIEGKFQEQEGINRFC